MEILALKSRIKISYFKCDDGDDLVFFRKKIGNSDKYLLIHPFGKKQNKLKSIKSRGCG
jgi:hypothetical protein